MAQQIKNLPVIQETQETQVQSLGQRDSLEKGSHSSILAWKISCITLSVEVVSPALQGLSKFTDFAHLTLPLVLQPWGSQLLHKSIYLNYLNVPF